MMLGAYQIQWEKISSWSFSEQDWLIIWHIRLPRILLAALVGAILAVAGAALQGLFRNPLADPGLIGISSGAALAVAIFIVVAPQLEGWQGLYGQSAAAFAGGLVASWVIFLIGRREGVTGINNLILAGVAISAIAAAGVGFLVYMSDDEQLRALTFWTMGSFGGAFWTSVMVTVTLGIPAVLWLAFQAKALNRLLLGQEEASYLGTDTRRLQRNIILATAVAVGAAVSMSGIIGFVGLVTPHLIRLIWNSDHRLLIPASALLGAILMVIADTLARTVVAPSEMPVGIITSLVGGPFFLWLLSQSSVRRLV